MASETLWVMLRGRKISRTRKTKPSSKDLRRGEVPAKINISWDEDQLETPTIERQVDISEALGNLRLDDLDVGSATLTEEEVEMVCEKRREEMAERLRKEGYEVRRPQDDNGEEEGEGIFDE